MKNLLFCVLCLLLAISAQAQAPRSATERAALIHSYQISLHEQATAEARELAQLLGLNESEIQLVRDFATARLQAQQEAQARVGDDASSRHALVDQAAAIFQSRVVNILNDRQLQAYLSLLASQAPAAPVAAPANTPPSKSPPRPPGRTAKRSRTSKHH